MKKYVLIFIGAILNTSASFSAMEEGSLQKENEPLHLMTLFANSKDLYFENAQLQLNALSESIRQDAQDHDDERPLNELNAYGGNLGNQFFQFYKKEVIEPTLMDVLNALRHQWQQENLSPQSRQESFENLLESLGKERQYISQNTNCVYSNASRLQQQLHDHDMHLFNPFGYRLQRGSSFTDPLSSFDAWYAWTKNDFTQKISTIIDSSAVQSMTLQDCATILKQQQQYPELFFFLIGMQLQPGCWSNISLTITDSDQGCTNGFPNSMRSTFSFQIGGPVDFSNPNFWNHGGIPLNEMFQKETLKQRLSFTGGSFSHRKSDQNAVPDSFLYFQHALLGDANDRDHFKRHLATFFSGRLITNLIFGAGKHLFLNG